MQKAPLKHGRMLTKGHQRWCALSFIDLLTDLDSHLGSTIIIKLRLVQRHLSKEQDRVPCQQHALVYALLSLNPFQAVTICTWRQDKLLLKKQQTSLRCDHLKGKDLLSTGKVKLQSPMCRYNYKAPAEVLAAECTWTQALVCLFRAQGLSTVIFGGAISSKLDETQLAD